MLVDILEKTRNKKQKEFAEILERVIHIGSIRIKEDDKQFVIEEILSRIEDYLFDFVTLAKRNKNQFHELLFSRFIYTNYINDWKIKFAKYIDGFLLKVNDDKEGLTNLLFSSEKAINLVPRDSLFILNCFIESNIQLWEAAIKYENEDIASEVIYSIARQVKKIIENPIGGFSEETFVREFIKIYRDILYTALNKKEPIINRATYAASSDWYIPLVIENSNFYLPYLKLFNQVLIMNLELLVDKEQLSLYKNFIDYASSNLRIGIEKADYNIRELISNEIEEYDKYESIVKKAKYLSNLDELNSLKEIAVKSFNERYLKKQNNNFAKEYINSCKLCIDSYYKFNETLRTLFYISSYCLYKKRYEFIKYQWESFGVSPLEESNIIHVDPSTFVRFYFTKQIYELSWERWEGKVESVGFYVQYFIFYLMRVFQNNEQIHRMLYYGDKSIDFSHLSLKNLLHVIDTIDSYYLPCAVWFINPGNHELQNTYPNNQLPLYVKCFSNEEERSEIFKTLRLDIKRLNDIPSFLENVTHSANEELESRAREFKVETPLLQTFQMTFDKEYKNHSLIYEVFKNLISVIYTGCIDDISFNINDRTFIHKSSFIEDWLNDYQKIAKRLALFINRMEELSVYNHLRKSTKLIDKDSFLKVIDECDDIKNLIIFTSVTGYYRYFIDYLNVEFKRENSQLDFTEGYFIYKEVEIPVYLFEELREDSFVMLVDKSCIGRIEKYLPEKCKKKNRIITTSDLFDISFEFYDSDTFSKDIEILLPEDIKSKDSEEKLKYLQARVGLNYQSIFKYIPPNRRYNNYYVEL